VDFGYRGDQQMEAIPLKDFLSKDFSLSIKNRKNSNPMEVN
jgi:hypothetical protein